MDKDEATQPERKQRLSLTKSQVKTAHGSELLSMCQEMASDGKLSKEEITRLKSWLEENSSIDIPAIQYLSLSVKEIFKDGIVSSSEEEELFRAIERILPMDTRKVAHEARTSVARQLKEEQKEKQKQEKLLLKLNKPIAHYDFMVAGVSHENRWMTVDRYVEQGDTVYLERDFGNIYSDNAIRIFIDNGECIGFVPERIAKGMASLLDDGNISHAEVKKILDGRDIPIPVVIAEIYSSNAPNMRNMNNRHREFTIKNEEHKESEFVIVIIGFAIIVFIFLFLLLFTC